MVSSRIRVFVPVNTGEFAALHKVSLRTARRRVAAIPGAVKTGRGWQVPILATDYAKRKGVSASSARRKGIRVTKEQSLAELMREKFPVAQQSRRQAAERWTEILVGDLASRKRPPNPATIAERFRKAKAAQLIRVKRLDSYDDIGDIFDEEWEGTDGISILLYH